MAATDWKPVSVLEPCVICKKPDWCTRNMTSGNVCCMRVASPIELHNGGWLHKLDDDYGRRWREQQRKPDVRAPKKSLDELREIMAGFRRVITDGMVGAFAKALRILPTGLRALGIGWSQKSEAFAFPMYNDVEQIVGIRLRNAAGRKWSVRGGREGIFMEPCGMFASDLFVVEGPTDTAAMIGLGLHVIGRPSCTGAVDITVRVLMGWVPARVIIIADSDEAGMRGATRLLRELVRFHSCVLLILPPNRAHKDARDWVSSGATAEDVRAAVDIAHERATGQAAGQHCDARPGQSQPCPVGAGAAACVTRLPAVGETPGRSGRDHTAYCGKNGSRGCTHSTPGSPS